MITELERCLYQGFSHDIDEYMLQLKINKAETSENSIYHRIMCDGIQVGFILIIEGQLPDNILDIRNTGCRCVQFAQRPVCLFRNDPGNRCFSCPGRPIKNQVRDLSAFDDPTEHSFFSQNMLLADHIIQRRRSYFICKRFIHCFSPSE